MECELTILMPCLNEARTLSACIQKAKNFLAEANISGEVLIVDNGSTDGSQSIAEAAGARMIHAHQRGYGAALKAGIEAAHGQFVIMGDADNSYDFLNLMPFLQKLREGYDLVMGNRFKGGIKKGAMPFLNRYLGNPLLSQLGRLFFRSSIGDFHCGLRGFDRLQFQALNIQGDGMEFASEMVVKASLKKLKITEVPTELHPDGRDRRPHLRPWRDGWRHLRLLLLFSPTWLFFYPGIFLFLVGSVSMALLYTAPFTLGRLHFDIHTMLFCGLFMIVGLQAVTLYIFSNLVGEFHLKIDPPALIKKYKSKCTLEKGILLGLLIASIGLIGSMASFIGWMGHDFGPLVPTQTMRLVIPSVTFCILGCQIIFSSFFLSLLELHHGNK